MVLSRSNRVRRKVALAAAGLLALATFMVRQALTSAEAVDRLSGDEITTLVEADDIKPLFDGTLLGWRIAPGYVLRGENPGGNASYSCPGRQWVSSTTPTDLDFTLHYMPQGVTINSVAPAKKLLCEGRAHLVAYDLELTTTYGEGQIIILRERVDQRAYMIEAPQDRISTGTLLLKPAVFVQPLHITGYGVSEIVKIEDDTITPIIDPFTIVIHAFGDNVPFEELKKVAEGAF